MQVTTACYRSHNDPHWVSDNRESGSGWWKCLFALELCVLLSRGTRGDNANDDLLQMEVRLGGAPPGIQLTVQPCIIYWYLFMMSIVLWGQRGNTHCWSEKATLECEPGTARMSDHESVYVQTSESGAAKHKWTEMQQSNVSTWIHKYDGLHNKYKANQLVQSLQHLLEIHMSTTWPNNMCKHFIRLIILSLSCFIWAIYWY